MGIEKTDKGKWKADIRPEGGYGKRYRKTFKTKAEALAWEAWMKEQLRTREDWEPKGKDKRKLSDLAKKYGELHATNLKDSKKRMQVLEGTIKGLGNVAASQFTATDFAEYRARRLAEGISANTINHEHAYLRAMFNELGRLGEWKAKNPLENIRQVKLDEKELTWLDSGQIEALLKELKKSRNSDAYLIALICLSTGARWSEAEGLRGEQIKEGAITYTSTKNGKNRTIPVGPELNTLLPKDIKGRVFGGSYAAFENAVKRAGIKLPKGQLTHVLRHTFASHFMQAGGNILTLQKILDHQSLTMTMRYSHLAPDHLAQAKELNPIKVGQFLDTDKK